MSARHETGAGGSGGILRGGAANPVTRAPREVEATPKPGIRAFFKHPHGLFDVIVTLDKGTVHPLAKLRQPVSTVGPAGGDVLPVKPLPSPPY